MRHIITTGLTAEYNLGCPSILYGTYELLKILYSDDFVMENYQWTKNPQPPNNAMGFRTVYYSSSSKEMLLAALKRRMGMGLPQNTVGEIIGDIEKADVVVDLYGICFCYNLGKEEYSLPKALLILYSRFLLPSVARILRVRTAKNTASYGPMVTKTNRRMACLACDHLFDIVSAREEKSREAIIEAGIHNEIILSPDIANLMPYEMPGKQIRKTIGISTSHQIVKQWKASESYFSCMQKLIRHIVTAYNATVLIIPNEWNPQVKNNDVDVSHEIISALGQEASDVQILDVAKLSSLQIKNAIATCEALVASRYHSCVAALSAGVPTLVLGWHYKYEELLRWYKQEEWILSCDDCDAGRLVSKFDDFLGQLPISKAIIQSQYPLVRDATIEAGRKIFACGGKHK